MSANRHVTLPAGFLAAGVKCGIKKSGKEDLALFASEKDCAAAVVTTRNQVVGAPVLWCRRVLPKGYGRVRAFVVNSGCSNVCTGKGGQQDAEAMAIQVAALLGSQKEKVLVASTGIIGHRLPMDKVRQGISAAAAALGTKNDSAALKAIMTTDTREKSAVARAKINGTTVTVAGVAKGAGMIAPSMATMISVLTTDAAVSPPALHKALLGVADRTFNAITVDSDTSTSDTTVIMASGAAGNTTIAPGSPSFRKFVAALSEVCTSLARQLAADGEGATRLIEIAVTGARDDADAAIAAKSIANSPLFKCAVHGADPNWGRILCALGKSAAKIDPDKTVVKIGPYTVFARGAGRGLDARQVSEYLKSSTVGIACHLGLGNGSYTAYTCDFSREYIAINADYHT